MSFAICEPCAVSVQWQNSAGSRLGDRACPNCHRPLASLTRYNITRRHGGRTHTLQGKPVRAGDTVEYLSLDEDSRRWRPATVTQARFGLEVRDLAGELLQHCAIRWPGGAAPAPAQAPFDLAAIEARAKAATEGMLTVETQRSALWASHRVKNLRDCVIATFEDALVDKRARADAELLAHARQDILALVARVRALEIEVRNVRRQQEEEQGQ